MQLFGAGAAVAEEAAALPTTQFLTWESLNTFTNTVMLVVLLVQALKQPLDRIVKIPTRYLVYAVALMVLLLTRYFLNGGLPPSEIVLAAVNAMLVTLSAVTVYDQIIQKVERKKIEKANGKG